MSDDLLQQLRAAITHEYAQSILLSGGLDSTAILAVAAKDLGKRPRAVTVSLNDQGEDLAWAQKATTWLGTPWTPVRVTTQEAIEEGLPALVRTHRTFDLGVINDLPYHFGLGLLAKEKEKSAMTGDGGDWLFGGYQFLWDKKESYNDYVREALDHLTWGATAIGEQLGIRVKQPLLQKPLIEQQLATPFEEKVRWLEREGYGDVAVTRLSLQARHDDEKRPGKPWGKVHVREALREYLPQELLWRPKTDLEFGSGMTAISAELERRVTDSEYEELRRRTGIRFWGGKAHAYLYALYEEQGGTILPPADGERTCEGCAGGVPVQRSHCTTCGHYEAE